MSERLDKDYVERRFDEIKAANPDIASTDYDLKLARRLDRTELNAKLSRERRWQLRHSTEVKRRNLKQMFAVLGIGFSALVGLSAAEKSGLLVNTGDEQATWAEYGYAPVNNRCQLIGRRTVYLAQGGSAELLATKVGGVDLDKPDSPCLGDTEKQILNLNGLTPRQGANLPSDYYDVPLQAEPKD